MGMGMGMGMGVMPSVPVMMNPAQAFQFMSSQAAAMSQGQVVAPFVPNPYVLPMHQSFPQTMQVFTGGTQQVQPVSADNAANPGQPSMGAKSAPQFAPPPAPKLQQQ